MENELCHYGVLGMRWGVRRYQDKNGRLTRAGRKRYNDTDKNSSKKNEEKSDHRLSQKQKTAIKVGAAVAATTLVAIGGYKLYKSGKLDALIDAGKDKVDELLKKKAGSSDFGKSSFESVAGKSATKVAQTVGGIKKLSSPESLSDTLKKVNPHLGDAKYDNNCTLCSIASFLRQKGYDVVAGSTGGKQQNLGGIVEECFKGAKVFDGSAIKFGRSRQDAGEMLLKRFGQNAEGVCSIQWKGGRGGHAFNWKIKEGIISFFDGQNGYEDAEISRLWGLIDPNGSLQLVRLDNLEVDLEAVKKYV